MRLGQVWAAMVLCVMAFGAAAQEPGISVTGVGEVAAVPDMAVVQVGVGIEAAQAEVAVRQVSERLGAVLDRVTALGIAARDVQTSQLTLNPVWDEPMQGAPRQVRGYLARSVVTIRARDLLVLGGLLDAVVRDGATEFGGLTFTLADPGPAEAAARAAAVRDAAAKARQIAEAAGVGLGPVRSLSEQDYGGRPRGIEMSAARSSADMPVAPGEMIIEVRVNAVYAIQ